jgi:hypothetical protein
MAMRWLLDEDGNVKPEFAADYAVRGRRADLDEEQEAVNAFANVAPDLDDPPADDGVVVDLTEADEPDLIRSGA